MKHHYLPAPYGIPVLALLSPPAHVSPTPASYIYVPYGTRGALGSGRGYACERRAAAPRAGWQAGRYRLSRPCPG